MEEKALGMVRRPYVLVGAGNVGNAIGRALSKSGLTIEAVISRSHSDATELAETVGAAIASTHVASIPKVPCNIICSVPDNEIPSVAQELSKVQREWLYTVVMHTSGARSSTDLDVVRDQGALTASFHPLKSIPDGTVDNILKGSVVGIEGDKLASEMATSLARLLGANPVNISRPTKAPYHLGAAVVSNFIVTLFGMANEILVTAGFTDLTAEELYGSLAENTVDNIRALGPGSSLTGPIARGDTDTIELHLEFMREHLPQMMPVYSSLATETVRLAVKAGKIDGEKAREVLDSIHKALLPSIDSNDR